MKNIYVSYERKTINWSSDDHFKSYYSTDGGSTWILLEDVNWAEDWITKTFPLLPAANDNSNLRLRFRIDDGSGSEEARLDTVKVTGDEMEPAELEVAKWVWNGTDWVNSVNALINDTLTFQSTIGKTGEANPKKIRFWDILDCSLEFADDAKVNDEEFACFETESYPFKPKVLHMPGDWTPGTDPVGDVARELCPEYDKYWEIVGWEDTADMRNVSACDQLQLVSSETPAIFEDDFEDCGIDPSKWWDYDEVSWDGDGNHYVKFSDNSDDLKSAAINATCKTNLVLSFDIKTFNWDYGFDCFYVRYSTDNSTWTPLAYITQTFACDWRTFTYNLPCEVNNQDLWLWFRTEDGSDDGERVRLDNVKVFSAPWYHVDRVPYTLELSNESTGMYFDSVKNWNEVDLGNPNETEWFGLCGCKDRYTLLNWQDSANVFSQLSEGDLVTMRNERGEEVQYMVTGVAYDLVVSREWEIACLLETENITIEYNATVVRCGVDNNTFVAKGQGCGDWIYSDPAVVTVTVPCPSGNATDPTGFSKDVYTLGEDVYGVGSGFAANKDVDIYILPFMTLVGGEDLTLLAIVGPVPVKTDDNGSIGAVNPLLVWPNPTPGHYLMVFDDPDGDFDPGADPLDDFTVIGKLPVFTPPGIVALIGLLSIVAIGTIARKNKKR
jgi:hypothetical protein